MKDVWNNGSGGDFTDTADWSSGTIPGAVDTAAISASGIYTVTTSANETILALTTAAGATLDITSGDFTMAEGTGTGVNAGTIEVDPNPGETADLIVGGTIDNKGTISLISVAGYTAELTVSPLGLKLEGGGQVTLFISQITGGTITNVDNTISGTGSIGALQKFINESKGVVDANHPFSSLEIGGYENAVTTNLGTLEATAVPGFIGGNPLGGTLDLSGTIINTDGLIQAGAEGSTVDLSDADIVGGTFRTSGGALMAESETTLDGRSQAITNEGFITVANSAAVNLLGTIKNDGTINLNSTGDATSLLVNATLSGGGNLTLSNNENNFILAAGGPSVPTNVNNVISGAGQIGGQHFTLINESKGVIEGDYLNPLVIAGSVINSGALLANSGDLIIEGTVTGKGTATISSGVNGGGLMEFGAASNASLQFGNVLFNNTAVFDLATKVTGKISGFASGDLIGLTDINFGAGTSFAYKSNAAHDGGTLTVTDGVSTAKLTFVGTYTQSNFSIANDGSGGTLISDPLATHSTSIVGVHDHLPMY